MTMKPVPFRNRWRIKGRLTTETELHIGDGREMWIGDRTCSATGKDPDVDASTVVTDVRGAACIPASSLKGVLRQRVCTSAGAWIDPVWDHLLGSPNPDDLKAVGGKLEFQDAFHKSGDGGNQHAWKEGSFADDDRTRQWWNPTRHTAVAVSVSLERRTKTARDNLLYHVEYVPPGETFTFEITGDNLNDDDVEKLSGLLAECNASAAQRVTLGALASNGWGRVACVIDEVKCLDSLDHWKSEVLAGRDPFESLPNRRDELAPEPPPRTGSGPADELLIDIALRLESPWLIRDPRQDERCANANAKAKHLADNRKPKNAVAIHDERDRLYAPAKSVRGALRARAEMILRTLGLPCAGHPGENPALSTKAGGPAQVLENVAKCDLASQLFGTAGWRGPLEVPRFTLVAGESTPQSVPQEFIAVDRFAGGVAGSLKFNAILAGATELHGQLRVDLARLGKVDEDGHSLGLLALVLRDLAEGDIPIGSGSAKGQGACRAEVTIAGVSDWMKDPRLKGGVVGLRKLASQRKHALQGNES